MQIAPDFSYESKDIKDWDAFDYMHFLRNSADRYEFNGKLDVSKALNSLARQLLRKEVHDYNKRNEGTPHIRMFLLGEEESS